MIELMLEVLRSLLGSTIRKMGEWSWPAKLIAVILLALVPSVYFRNEIVSLGSSAQHLAKAAFAGTSIPVAGSLKARTYDIAAHLRLRLHSELEAPDRLDPRSAWTLAQAMMAITRSDAPIGIDYAHYLRDLKRADCNCWQETPTANSAPNIVVSAWVLTAMGWYGEKATREEMQFLLDEQEPSGGGWSIFQALQNEKPNFASTYATAWSVIALHTQQSIGLVDNATATRVSSALNRGISWLLGNRVSKARWKDYPLDASYGKIFDSLSGLALHALHVASADGLSDIDREWLDNLPEEIPKVDDKEVDYEWVPTSHGKEMDGYVQIKLPWLLIGTIDAYPHGSYVQRARALRWIEESLAQTSIRHPEGERDWWQAEVLISLHRLICQHSGTESCEVRLGDARSAL